MKKKKILMFCTHAFPYIGGLEKFAFELAKRLVARGRYEVTLFCLNTENVAADEVVDGVRFFRIPAHRMLNGAYSLPHFGYGKYLKQMQKESFDIVMTHTRFFYTTFMGYLFARRYNIPLVHVDHGSTFVRYGQWLVQFIGTVVDHTWGKYLLRRCDCVVGVSARTSQFLRQQMRALRVETINYGIESCSDEYFPRNNDALQCIFAGRIIVSKGLLLLAEALNGLSQKLRSQIHLHIYGNGAQKQLIQDRYKALALEDIVSFRDAVSNSDVPALLRRYDVFVSASYMAEGLPFSLLEAGESGCALIATDVGGSSDIVIDSVGGIVVPPNDVVALRNALTRMIVDRDFCSSAGHYSQEYVRDRFSWKKCVDAYEQIFIKLYP